MEGVRHPPLLGCRMRLFNTIKVVVPSWKDLIEIHDWDMNW